MPLLIGRTKKKERLVCSSFSRAAVASIS